MRTRYHRKNKVNVGNKDTLIFLALFLAYCLLMPLVAALAVGHC